MPDPVYLALQLIKMEQLVHEKADECKALEEKVSEQNAEMEKSKKEREFEVTKLKKDVKVMQEKLDKKMKEAEEKGGKKDDKYGYHGKNGVSKLTDELKEELKKLKEEKEKVRKYFYLTIKDFAHTFSLKLLRSFTLVFQHTRINSLDT